jgi:hypothetical protein
MSFEQSVHHDDDDDDDASLTSTNASSKHCYADQKIDVTIINGDLVIPILGW